MKLGPYLFGWLIAGASIVDAAPDLVSVPGADLFETGRVQLLRITIPPEALAELRTNSRKTVKASVESGTETYREVGIHLKGSTGSFRPVTGKPGFTLNIDKFIPEQRFHGLRRIHLNNSVEDPTYMNERVGSELFEAAGVPTPRVTHAVVELNGRHLGLYVLKEGFTVDFLSLHFRKPRGNLYDTGEGHDIDEPLEMDLGKNPNDRSDVQNLAAAAQEPNLQKRWIRLQSALDIDRFLSFMAVEIILGHRDGYCLARNNFRIYHDVDTDRMVFLPHGMDQLFGNPGASIEPLMNGMLAKTLLEIPEAHVLYRQRCSSLLSNVIDANAVVRQIDIAAEPIRPLLGQPELKAWEEAIASLKSRVVSRIRSVNQQIAKRPLQILKFETGIAPIQTSNWKQVDASEAGSMNPGAVRDGRMALEIHAGPVTSASWRTRVLLLRGRYRFEASVSTAAVQPLPFGRNQGAALRVSGFSRSQESVIGTQKWTLLHVDFEISSAQREIELACELRASRGDAWFDLASLQLVQTNGESRNITVDKP